MKDFKYIEQESLLQDGATQISKFLEVDWIDALRALEHANWYVDFHILFDIDGLTGKCDFGDIVNYTVNNFKEMLELEEFGHSKRGGYDGRVSDAKKYLSDARERKEEAEHAIEHSLRCLDELREV